ncbi:MAG TPA: hypothetical protein VFW78_08645 [Bacteroidia bacterium]|nr:hypothetical protein [Bacteroidia bacterium]
MKKLITGCALLIFCAVSSGSAQTMYENLHFVTFTKLKMVWPENGSMNERDSLIAIYTENVIKKNTYILSHREYSHFFTTDNKDYIIIEEFKDYAAWEASNKMNDELEAKAFGDKDKRKAFMDAMNRYFENWHGDALYHTNPKVNKN